MEGVGLLRAHTDKVVAVLLGRTMPDVQSKDAVRALNAVNPELPIILTTGRSEQEAQEQFVGMGLAGFVRRPFLPATLIGKVRDVLDTGS